MISFTKGTLKENLQRLMETSPNGVETSEEYRAEVAGIGENVWSTNGVTYDTPEKAKEWLTQLADRWFGYDMSRVVPVSTTRRETIDPSDPAIFQNFRA